MLHSQNVHLSCSGWRQKPQGQTFGLTPYVAFSSFMFSVHILQLHIIITYIFFEKCYHCVVKSWPNWVAVGLPCAAPLVVGHESRQLFLSSSESSESGQRLPKINRLSVQPGAGAGSHTMVLAHSGSPCPHPNTAPHFFTENRAFYVTQNSTLTSCEVRKLITFLI